MKHPSELFRGGSTVRRFLYDGHTLIAEYGATGSQPLRRFVHGPGTDEPIAYFEGPGVGLTSRTYPHQDERGSVVAVANADGTLAAANVYDEYGASQGTFTGRFGYTGQVRLPALGLYYYRARMYDPALGRFLQTDPIGYGDGMNMYAYVGGDPVNGRDPSGTCNTAQTRMCDKRDLPEIANGFVQQHFSHLSASGQSQLAGAVLGYLRYEIDLDDVKSRRDSLVRPPFTVDLAGFTPGLHGYDEGPNVICARQFRCTAGAVGAVYSLAGNAMPGAPMEPIRNGQRYLVWIGAIPLGYVRSYASDDGLQVRNVATAMHVMGGPLGGEVRRVAYEREGTWYSYTLGFGTNWNGPLGAANTLLAPGTWRDQDESIRRQLEGGR